MGDIADDAKWAARREQTREDVYQLAVKLKERAFEMLMIPIDPATVKVEDALCFADTAAALLAMDGEGLDGRRV